VPVFTVLGPRDAGPGERERMLDEAARLLGNDDHVRVDVPGRGGDGEGEGVLREGVQAVVPALQSGSLFGGPRALLVVDAQRLLKGEAEIVAELVGAVDPDEVVAVFVAEGAVPAPLGAVLRRSGETITVKKLRERDASAWLATAARERGIRLGEGAAAVLLQRYGSDVAALGRALDQLAVNGGTVTAASVRGRFQNRPDEPMWHLADAIVAGDEGEALRRLADFLEHGHPLALLAFLEGEVRRRSLAAVAPDLETYAAWVGGSPQAYPVRKVWERRNRTGAAGLRRAIGAIARAEAGLKTAPEATHRVTMERLVVALSRWLGR